MNILGRAMAIGALASLTALLASFAHAGGSALATYQGADRLTRIEQAAKREGELTIYTSTPVEDIRVMSDAFERKYGVRTKVWRASSGKVLQRGVAEARANRHDVDVFETNGPELEALVGEKLLTPVWSPSLASLIPEAQFDHQSWVGARLLVFTMAYNTNLVRQADLPESYEGFADPKWKGKLAIEAEDWDWFAAV